MKRNPILVMFAFLAGCLVIPPPTVRPFADGKDWVLVEPLRYSIRDSGVVITVPTGFVTDFASIPRAFWSVLVPTGRYGRAAIVHDYLYWEQTCTREQADRILLLGMTESGVDRVTREAIYAAVRLAGHTAWLASAEERKLGKPRIIPAAYLEMPGDAVWSVYRDTLFTKGVRATPMSGRGQAPEYCTAGDQPRAARL
jgi:hypothetical protein